MPPLPSSCVVTPTDDVVTEGTITSYTIAHSVTSDDSAYEAISNLLPSSSIAVTIYDTNEAGVIFDTSLLQVTEGTTASYTVVLTSEPTNEVTVAVTGSDSASVDFGHLVFTDLLPELVQGQLVVFEDLGVEGGGD